MQAAVPPRALNPAATPSAAEPLPTKLERLHTEALDALRLVMTKALDSITTLPPPALEGADTDEPAQSPADHARTVTQRMRLALTAARDLLRYTTDNDSESPSPSSTGRRCPSPRGRMRVPGDAHQSGAEANRCGTQDRDQFLAPAPESASILLAATRPVLSGAERTKAGSEAATQSVSLISRFGERLDPPHDSGLSTHDSDASPRNSSLVTHTSPPPPRLTPNYPPIPPKPLYRRPGPVVVPAHFTNDEIDFFEATLRTQDPFPKPLYRRLIEWRVHCNDYYLDYPLPITHETLAARSPWEKKRVAACEVNRGPPDTA
ncbi:MAG: hypothetical protein Q8L55_07100 [Phycisphaerales bacterium]|nr:hypothetical protein [Phycisphaerales bacterium]